MVRYVLALDPALARNGADEGELEELVKIALARAGFTYSTATIRPAIAAVLHVHRVLRRFHT